MIVRQGGRALLWPLYRLKATMRRRCGFWALLAIWQLWGGLLMAQTYSLEDLGNLTDLAGRSDSGPHAMNGAGAVAGANATNGFYNAILYNGAWKDLGTLGGGESVAAGVNASAQVVGYSQTSSGTTNGFIWTSGATDGVAGNVQMKSLGTLGGPVSQAYAINDSGQVTGYSDVPAHPANHQHAFVYSAGMMIDVGQQLTSLVNSYGYGINASGHVAGTAYDVNYTAPHAFVYDGMTATDLGVFGGAGSSALAINSSDTIAGYLTTTTSYDHAFSYSGGTITDLGTLGGHYSYGLSVNNSNVIVGGSFTDALDSVYHAFVCPNGTMLDLNQMLDKTGAGWTLVEARAVNDAGQIAGVGVYGGSNHAFRLTPITTQSPVPVITGIQVSSGKAVLRFMTVAQRMYSLQTNATLTTPGWGNLVTNLVGNGSTLSVTNAGAGSDKKRFYRVLLLPP